MPEETQNYKWVDPDPKSQGVLLSDRIKFYVNKVGLIDPADFRPESLGPASYNLRVGDEYFHNDKKLKPRNGVILIPSNGLVYVKLHEKLNLPFYMVAHHDLKVRQVYRGFLAGNSLQIDPGYSGHINYPIFNFTDEDREIYVGDEIAVMCFIKTTVFGNRGVLSRVETEDELRQSKVQGIGGNECELFRVQKDRTIREYWYGGEKHRNTIELIHRRLQRWRRIAIWGAIGAGVTILVGVVGPVLAHCAWISSKVMDQNKEISTINAAIVQMQADINKLTQVDSARPADESVRSHDTQGPESGE